MFWIIKLWNLHLSVEIFAKDFQVPVNSSKKVFALKILQRTTHTVSPYHRIIVLYCIVYIPYLGIVSPAALEKVQGRRNPFWMQLTVNKTDSMDSRCAHNRKNKTKLHVKDRSSLYKMCLHNGCYKRCSCNTPCPLVTFSR